MGISAGGVVALIAEPVTMWMRTSTYSGLVVPSHDAGDLTELARTLGSGQKPPPREPACITRRREKRKRHQAADEEPATTTHCRG